MKLGAASRQWLRGAPMFAHRENAYDPWRKRRIGFSLDAGGVPGSRNHVAPHLRVDRGAMYVSGKPPLDMRGANVRE